MSTPIVFPSDLRSLSGNQSYPQIEFTVHEDDRGGNTFTSIYLPMPGSVQFSDGGTYGTIDLGSIAAGGGLDALSDLMGGYSDDGSNLMNTATQQFHSLATRIKATLASKLPGVDKETAMFAQKKVKSPNQNTTFQGNKLRSFSFSFKLIARSQADTNAIAAIQQMFRRYAYAGSSADAPNVVLDYPPLWQIKFLLGDAENPYLPKIFACYLETFGCSFNQDQNIFRNDGSPFDASFQLTFQETRVLTRNDIDLLSAGKSDRGIDPLTGLATSKAPAGIDIPIPSPSSLETPTQSTNPNKPSGSSGPFAG
jgi:hypothetical protein